MGWTLSVVGREVPVVGWTPHDAGRAARRSAARRGAARRGAGRGGASLSEG
jgi:hypothetical protein